MALTDKQDMFCQECLIDLNATQAAVRARLLALGYENSTKPDIQSRIIDIKSERNAVIPINISYVFVSQPKSIWCGWF